MGELADKKYTKSLIPQRKDDSFFVEVEDDQYIQTLFEVSYYDSDRSNGTLYLKLDVTIEDLKQLPEEFRDAVIKISNNDISWENATGYKNPRPGECFRMPSLHNCWISTKPIGLTLVSEKKSFQQHYKNKFDEELYNRDLHKGRGRQIESTVSSEDKTSSIILDNKVESSKKFNSNIYSEEVKKANATHLQEVNESIIIVKDENASLSELGSHESIIQETNKHVNKIRKEYNDKKINHVNTLLFDRIQYLKSGRDGEAFFFEGSEVDKTGASFKMEYDSRSLKGEYSLIIDFNNLKTINSGFRRGVIKMINNGTTIREATGFTMVEKGQAHFSKQDHVWMVDKPLIIKLIK